MKVASRYFGSIGLATMIVLVATNSVSNASSFRESEGGRKILSDWLEKTPDLYLDSKGNLVKPSSVDIKKDPFCTVKKGRSGTSALLSIFRAGVKGSINAITLDQLDKRSGVSISEDIATDLNKNVNPKRAFTTSVWITNSEEMKSKPAKNGEPARSGIYPGLEGTRYSVRISTENSGKFGTDLDVDCFNMKPGDLVVMTKNIFEPINGYTNCRGSLKYDNFYLPSKGQEPKGYKPLPKSLQKPFLSRCEAATVSATEVAAYTDSGDRRQAIWKEEDKERKKVGEAKAGGDDLNRAVAFEAK